MSDGYCWKCPFLYYDKERSTPSVWIGEGCYVWRCRLYNNTWLNNYLYGDEGRTVFRCEKCLDEKKKENLKGKKRK